MNAKILNVLDIKIPYEFYRRTPSAQKMNKCRKYYREHKKLDRDIVIDEDGYIVDGYIGYLVLKENDILATEVIVSEQKNVYIFGKHEGCQKEYCWCATDKTTGLNNAAIGNLMCVETRFGKKTAKITRVLQSDTPPVHTPIRRVIKCYSRSN